jgi:RimJ/RimL family protein N-acetyltransferase
VPVDLIEEPAVLVYSQAELARDADYFPWSARAILLKSSMQMIGHVRFHNRPDPDYLRDLAANAVEVGYVIFAAHRRQRYAEEALVALMTWARDSQGIGRIVASISPDNLTSLKLASKLGFRRIGEHVDAVDGIEHVYFRDASVGI